uniref:NADH-ubiquinone oxidoreductase chain 2 n=1 Tax=Staphylinoidea sp. 4 KM-2017 TaxID=2219458 RepID=A0A346RFD9_9COLE|nr:NADH dehydrogenase subunit 2 [Staphylinoidea sp. 4 KM-2017]
MFYYYKIFFFLILMTGSLISISSNSWMGMWLGLEINLMAFIPLIHKKNNILSSESSIKYFLIQVLASIILLFTMILMSKFNLIMLNINNSMILIFNSMLLTKMGMTPFHFWFPEVIEGLNWINCFILLTWQKLTPMILIMYNLNYELFFIMVIMSSMIISGIMGINQLSLRKILAYSSINHMAWMLSAMMLSETIWSYYFIIYTLMTLNITLILNKYKIYYNNQLMISFNNNFMMKLIFSMNFLSLGGLPPFIGFFPKWLTIQYMISINWIFLPLMMMFMTLLTLYYYTQLTFKIIILSFSQINYYNSFKSNNFTMMFINILVLSSLIMYTIFFNFL